MGDEKAKGEDEKSKGEVPILKTHCRVNDQN
jgi:hypothetical protein